MQRYFIILAVLLFSVTGCKSTFTYSMRQDIAANKLKINKVQFYNSETIELRRIVEIKNKKRITKSGKLSHKKGKVEENVLVRSKTPGVCVNDTKETLYISFDAFDDNKNLPFILKKGKYVLATKNGKVTYMGITYKVIDGKKAHLLIKSTKKEVDKDKEKILRGRKL